MTPSNATRRILLMTLAVLLGAAHATAVPMFARRYATSCATCHQAFPRLNAVGESFRLMGYEFVDDERYRKREPVELGDEAYARLWPDALWPSHVEHSAPLSFASRFMLEVDLDGSRSSTVTYLLPEEVELVWAGKIGDNISVYGDIIALQKDFGGEDPQSWATVKAWIQFQSLFDSNHKLNLRVGSVGTQTMGLFTARDANFYGTHFYLYTTWSMPTLQHPEAAGLASFNGNNFSIGPQTGIELNSVGERWFAAGGVVNGDLENVNGARPASDISFLGMGRNTGRNDTYLHLAYKIGGLPFDRSRSEPEDTLTTGAEFWRDDSLILSAYGYSGTATIEAETLDGDTWTDDDDFYRVGLGAQVQMKDLSLSAAWMEGRNDRPYGQLSGASVDSTNWHLEVIGFPYPWLVPYLRYEAIELDLPADVPGLRRDADITRFVGGAKMMVRPNVSCTVEAAHYTDGEQLEEGFDDTLFVLLGIAF